MFFSASCFLYSRLTEYPIISSPIYYYHVIPCHFSFFRTRRAYDTRMTAAFESVLASALDSPVQSLLLYPYMYDTRYTARPRGVKWPANNLIT